MTEDRMETLRFLAEKFPDGDFAYLVGKLEAAEHCAGMSRLWRELARKLRAERQAARGERDALRAQVARLEARQRELVEALDTYGGHLLSCRASEMGVVVLGVDRGCTCGYGAAQQGGASER